MLRGFPIDRYSDEDIETIYYGLGLHLGTPVCQNLKGDLLGNVMNVGESPKKKHVSMKPMPTCRITQTCLMCSALFVCAKQSLVD